MNARVTDENGNALLFNVTRRSRLLCDACQFGIENEDYFTMMMTASRLMILQRM